MSVKGIIMFLGMNNTRLERKVLIILDFENGFLPTYLPQRYCMTVLKSYVLSLLQIDHTLHHYLLICKIIGDG